MHQKENGCLTDDRKEGYVVSMISQLSLIKKDTTKQRCCVRGGEDSTPLPNHKSSILQDQASLSKTNY